VHVHVGGERAGDLNRLAGPAVDLDESERQLRPEFATGIRRQPGVPLSTSASHRRAAVAVATPSVWPRKDHGALGLTCSVDQAQIALAQHGGFFE
jgi:hypothetical protein